MTHADIDLDPPGLSSPHQSRKKRRIMLGALAVCGLVMALVLLSDPRVMTQIDKAVTLVKSRTTSVTASAPVAFSAGTAPARIAPAISAAVQITPVNSTPVQATPATSPVMTPARTSPAPSTRAPRVRVRRAGILSDK